MTTAILEHLSTLSVSGQQLRRLPKILENGLPKMPCTVPETDVPQLFREPYIRTGYRPTGHQWRYYFFSLFQKHNEVVNVWTHLLAALAVLLRFWAFAEAEALSWTSANTLPSSSSAPGCPPDDILGKGAQPTAPVSCCSKEVVARGEAQLELKTERSNNTSVFQTFLYTRYCSMHETYINSVNQSSVP